jgi:hypothetical protein
MGYSIGNFSSNYVCSDILSSLNIDIKEGAKNCSLFASLKP